MLQSPEKHVVQNFKEGRAQCKIESKGERFPVTKPGFYIGVEGKDFVLLMFVKYKFYSKFLTSIKLRDQKHFSSNTLIF